jgi:hypothetical protein
LLQVTLVMAPVLLGLKAFQKQNAKTQLNSFRLKLQDVQCKGQVIGHMCQLAALCKVGVTMLRIIILERRASGMMAALRQI